jgi:hypothetical protein
MMDDFEDTITSVLRAHDEGGPVDVTALRRGSLARARSIRRRRVGLTGAAAAVAIVGGAVAVNAASSPVSAPIGGGGSYGGSYGAPPGGPANAAVAVLPRAGEPGAAVRPDLVGHDPGTLHFDVDTGALGADEATYAVNPGVETATLAKDGLNFAWYALGPDRATLDGYTLLNTHATTLPEHPLILGRPATVERFAQGVLGTRAAYRISWQPVDGLWAAVAVDDPDLSRALKAANALKLNIAQRCVAPMLVTSLPAGYTWTGCNITLGTPDSDFPWEMSQVVLSRAGGGSVVVAIGNVSAVDHIVPNTTAVGHPAEWVDQQLTVPMDGWVNLYIGPGVQGGTLSQGEATDFAARTQVGTDFTDPTRWPARPVR